MKFVDCINEMHAREQGIDYFILPASIRRLKNCQSLNDEIIRNLSISEILDSMKHMFKRFLIIKEGFEVSTRPKNNKVLSQLGINPQNPNSLRKLIKNFLQFLKVDDFIETQNKVDGVVYIFKIRDFAKRFNLSNYSSSLKKHMYLKFNFIYGYEDVEDDNNAKKRIVFSPTVKYDINNEEYIIVRIDKIILYEISFHDDQ